MKDDKVLNAKAIIVQDVYKIDWDKINTVDDIKMILEALGIQVRFNYNNECPEQFKEMFNKGLLIKIDPS